MTSLQPLSPLEWRLYVAICSHSGHEGTTSNLLREHVRSLAGETLEISSINPLLDRLVSKGWIRKETEHAPKGQRVLRGFYFPTLPSQEGLAQLASTSSRREASDRKRIDLARVEQFGGAPAEPICGGSMPSTTTAEANGGP